MKNIPCNLLTILLILSCSIGVAQTPSLNNPIPLSPNAASIAQYGNVPIGLYTGQPNISFPIYEINTGYLKVPIALAYNYNGLKVEDYPGWVGTGWTLNTPGVITRQTRGLPDESPNGFNGQYALGKQVQSYIELGRTPTTIPDFENQYPDYYNLLMGIVQGRMDSEPDMFTFSIPGYSGRFYFDESQCDASIKTAKVIPYQNVFIKGYFDYDYKYNTLRGQIDKFEITDERGNLYTFNIKERNADAIVEDEDHSNPSLDFLNTWYLTTITDPFQHQIQYNYKPARKIAMPLTVSERLVVPENWTTTPVLNTSFSWEMVLDHITFKNGLIRFIEENNEREDWNYQNWYDHISFDDTGVQRPKALSKITVSINNSVVKEIKFNYSYFGDNSRLRLDSFQETNGDKSIPPYVFTYRSGSFPRIGNKDDLFSQDHWGYYTGGINKTLLPPINLSLSDGSKVNIDGNLRTPVPGVASSGLLTSIQYPTGGMTTFEYEPNEYLSDETSANVPFGQCSQDFTPLGTASIKKEIESSALTLDDVQPITIPKATCAKIDYRLSTGNSIETEVTVMLIEKTSQSALFIHKLRTQSSGTSSEDSGYGQDKVFSLEPGEYELQAFVEHEGQVADMTNLPTAIASVTLYTAIPSSVNSNRIAGGMRVKSVKDCSIGSASGCVSKYYSYRMPTDPTKSSGSLASPIYYGYNTNYVFSENGADITTGLGIVYTGSSLLPVVNTMGNSVGYQFVTMQQASDGSNGKSIYKFISPADQPDMESATVSSSAFPFPPRIDRDFRRGTQILEQDFLANNNDTPQKESIITPQFQTKSSSMALKTGFNYEFADGLTGGGIANGVDPGNSFRAQLTRYDLVPYRIESSWKGVYNQKETIKDLINARELTTETNFFYDNPEHMRVTGKETKNSTNVSMLTTYSYPQDVANVQNLSSAEIAGIQSCPDKSVVIEEKRFKEANLLQTKRSLYNGPNLSRMQQSEGTAPLVDMAVFTSYDPDGNILSFTTKEGNVHSYRYGYNNMLPVVHSLNALATDIYYESFEEGLSGTGNSNAKSGDNVMNGNTFIFPSTFLPSSLPTEKMSYWYWANNQWNFSGELPYSSSFSVSGTMIDEVRAYPAGASMITFCYKPGVGMTTRTDENNRSQYFEFDDLGRLLLSRDSEKNIISAYDYYYKKGN